MAVKGAASKEIITKIILGVFKGSFVCGKEIRIPVVEGADPVQIKLTLTAAKDLIAADGSDTVAVTQFVEPTEEEKVQIQNLLKELGIQ